MKTTSVLITLLLVLSARAYAYTIEYPPQCFAKKQGHKPGELVVQGSIVHLPAGPEYTLVDGSGTLVANRFYADQYGQNVIEGSDGK